MIPQPHYATSNFNTLACSRQYLFQIVRHDSGVKYPRVRNGESRTLASLKESIMTNRPGTLTMDSKGNIYGTASRSGADGAGTVWEVTP